MEEIVVYSTATRFTSMFLLRFYSFSSSFKAFDLFGVNFGM